MAANNEEEQTVTADPEEQVDDFLSDYGPGNDTEPLDQDSGSSVQEEARQAEEEAERVDEAENAEPADNVEVETESESAESEQQDVERGESQDVEQADEGDGEDVSELDDEEDLDFEPDGALADILGEGEAEDAGVEDSSDEQEAAAEEDRIAQLEQKIDQLASRLEGKREDKQSEQVETVEGATDSEKLEFVQDQEQLEQFTQDVDSFNELMSKMFHTMREQVTQVVPQISREVYKTQRNVKQQVDKFWNENPDLKDWETQLQAVAQEVQSQNPEAGTKQVLDKSAKVLRERLDLHRQSKETNENTESSNSTAQQPPTPGGSSSGPPTGEDMSDEEEEIDDMLQATEL